MESYILDDTDFGILNHLQMDARLTYKELAHKLNRSQSPIQDRVKRLERLGYIRCYVALVDYERLRQCMMAYVQVSLKDHGADALQVFQEQVCCFTEVLECHHTTGGHDFLLKVVVSNMQSYRDFLWQKLGQVLNVGSVNSSVVIGQAKLQTAVPVGI